MASLLYQLCKPEGPMQIESPPLNDEHTDRDVDADLDADRAPWLGGTSRRASGFKGDQFPSDSLQTSGRITRTLALSSVAVLVGVGATLSWQMVGPWAQSATPPAPAVTSAELQAQLKPAALDLAIVKRSVEQLATNQDQLARKQDQMAQAIATLQAAEQDLSQKILGLAPPAAPPAPKAAHVPPPKSLKPPVQ
jgi:hypothetical protein